MRGWLTYILLILLFAVSAIAQSTMTLEPILDKVDFGQQATFSLSITNTNPETQRYSIFSPTSGAGWAVDPRPLENRIMEIPSGQTGTTEVGVDILQQFTPGVYEIPLFVTSDKGEKQEFLMRVFIGPFEPKQFLPAIRMSVEMNDKIDVSDIQTVKVSLDNLNPLDLTNLVVRTKSDIDEFNFVQDFKLPPLKSKTIDLAVKVNKYQQPKTYTIFFTLEKDSEIIKVVDKRIEILPKILPFEKETTTKEAFLKTTEKNQYTNQGNVKNIQQVRIPIGFFESLFTTTEPKAQTIKEDRQKYLTWNVELGPNQIVNTTITKNMRVPLYILIIILILIWVYMYYKNPITITKTAAEVKIQEGGISGMKVTMQIKNSTNRKVSNMLVIDTIPGIADIQRDVEMGTLRPSELLRDKLGTVKVHWKIAKLEPKEERIISYKVKAKLKILGEFKLPRAKVKFTDNRKRKYISYSNAFLISAEKA